MFYFIVLFEVATGNLHSVPFNSSTIVPMVFNLLHFQSYSELASEMFMKINS